uniref:Uncharacterized protein n=1 Tax=Glossina pallidipes TaxID=7398 RepID=A0A1A9ZKW4_GLOPL
MIIKTRRTREINLKYIRLRSIGCSVNLVLIAFSICPNSSRSRGKRNIEIAIPLRPARAVRPTRCIYSLGVRDLVGDEQTGFHFPRDICVKPLLIPYHDHNSHIADNVDPMSLPWPLATLETIQNTFNDIQWLTSFRIGNILDSLMKSFIVAEK